MARLFSNLSGGAAACFNHLTFSSDWSSPSAAMTNSSYSAAYYGDGNHNLVGVDTLVNEEGGMTSTLTAGNYKWTVPKTGRYLQFYNVRHGSGTGYMAIFAYVNGIVRDKRQMWATYGDKMDAGYFVLDLIEGDEVQLYEGHSTAGVKTWEYADQNGGTYGDLTGCMFLCVGLDGNYQNDFLEGSFFLHKTEFVQTMTANVETVFDDLITYGVPKNASLGSGQTVTVDKAGEWLIGCVLNTSKTQHQRKVRIKKNGSLTYTGWMNGYNYPDNIALSGGGFMKQLTLAASDTLDFYWHSSTADRIHRTSTDYTATYGTPKQTMFFGLRLSA